MDPVAELFDRLDTWRHFPNYQLERRADIFFSLFLAEVLEWKLGFPVLEHLAPEFPVHIGTIYPETPIHSSKKIDYLAISADGTTPIFVELKTETRSRNDTQDRYLEAARRVGLVALLDGLLEIFRATQAKRKYHSLLLQLETMGLLHVPEALTVLMGSASLRGANQLSRKVEIVARPTRPPAIVYVQPNGEAPDIVDFRQFADIVERHNDTVSCRFAMALREWADVPA